MYGKSNANSALAYSYVLRRARTDAVRPGRGHSVLGDKAARRHRPRHAGADPPRVGAQNKASAKGAPPSTWPRASNHG